MARKHLTTSIDITASPEMVWNILTDFLKYEEWNDFIKSIEGEVAEGKIIKAHIGNMKFSPKVLAYRKNHEFRWLGHLWIKGLFDGEHIFIIEDLGNGKVRFRQEEKFSGLLVGFFTKMLDNETLPAFMEMNQRIKALAENRNI